MKLMLSLKKSFNYLEKIQNIQSINLLLFSKKFKDDIKNAQIYYKEQKEKNSQYEQKKNSKNKF